MNQIITIEDAIEKLGRENIISGTGLTTRSVSVAKTDSAFPASWYPIIKRLAAEKGLDVSDGLFKFKKIKEITK
ncbi:MAG: hypothetical protein COA43_01115 [Robiginitomaculum sp.]|nr:MAG: hypothetical protein COA43_01115 [Robiginitomaculum sp.]